MNITRISFVLLAFMSACGSVFSRAISKEEEIYKRSKRSRSADHDITERNSRNNAELSRKWYLAKLLSNIDTSGEPLSSTEPTGSGLETSTTTTKLRGSSDGSGARHTPRRRQKGKGRKGRKNRRGRRRHNRKNRGHKKNRRNRRRHTRSVAESVAALLESEHGETILDAIANIIQPGEDAYESIEALEEVVKSSAKKCKCT